MMYLTGVRWGRSERTFAVVFTQTGDPAWVLPGFEEMRARELIQVGEDIRVWQEDESPYQRIAGHPEGSRSGFGTRRDGGFRALFRLRRCAPGLAAGAETGVRERATRTQGGRR